MTLEQFERVQELFRKSFPIAPHERSAFLDAHCAGDAEVRAKVERMLSHAEEQRTGVKGGDGDRFLESPAMGRGFHVAEVDDIERRLKEEFESAGRYRLLDPIGEGGFGTVYKAEQLQPVRRIVAIKVIKLGMDTKRVIARFEAERQTLAMMDHPAIARVFDAGATTSGRPYFVMEYVQGVPITKYCDTSRMAARQRIELFVQVVSAVQHAHQKGIIHRDIKPSNVLVTVLDASPTPKLIDFGIARAMDESMGGRTLVTEQGQMIGTPEYMSPEQAAGSGDIDTRTDIYSLGMLLYELLVGTTPFDCASIKSAGHLQIQQIVCEQPSPTPSARLRTLGDVAAAIAAQRQSEPTTLLRILKGDLDWIVMKAIEKDRARRYETADAFIADLRRYLSDEAVLARPPTAAYRFRKFARRNKGPLAAGIAILTLLVGGIIGTTIGLSRALAAGKKARDEAAVSAAVNAFLNEDLLAAVSPDNQGKDVRMREVLDAASARIEGRFKDQPVVEAAIRSTLGQTYLKLGDFPSAEKHLLKAKALSEQSLGLDAEMTLKSADTLSELRSAQGKYDEAEALMTDCLARRRRIMGDYDPSVALTMMQLGGFFNLRGRYKDADRFLAVAMERLQRAFGPNDRRTIEAMHDLAVVYSHLDRYPEAEKLYLKMLAASKSLYGTRHPNTLTAQADLAMFYQAQARFEEAITLYREVVEGDRAVLGETHPTTLETEHGLATLYYDRGKYPEAAELFEKNLELRRKVIGPVHPKTLTCMNSLARVYLEQERYDKAEPLCSEAVKEMRAHFGQEPRTIAAIGTLAKIYQGQNRYAEAERLCKEVLDMVVKQYGDNNVNALTAKTMLADTYQLQSRPQEAEALTKSVIASARKLVPGHWRLGIYLTSHGIVLMDLKRFNEAEETLLEAHDILHKTLGTEHSKTIRAAKQIEKLYTAWSKPEKAAQWRAQTATSQAAS